MKVAIVAIARMENDYINEWISHHLGIGVDHIYVYDNSSSEEEKLSGRVYEKYLNQVTIIPAYDKSQYQMPAYKDSYLKYRDIYDYLIYIDIDEFIMLQKDKNINEFVQRLPEDCECYRMNWVIYGDNDIVNRDTSSSVVKDFTTPSKNNKRGTTTKSIIKGGLRNIDFISVHYAIRNSNGNQSNLKTYYGNMIDITNELPIKSKSLNIHRKDYTYIKLNHYITKSLCEFICQKMRRPDAAWNYERNIDKDFFQYNEKNPEKMEMYNHSSNVMRYYYWTPKNKLYVNAGDYFNKILINKLYHCVCTPINDYTNIDVAFCGSILTDSHIRFTKHIVGCGFQNDNRPSNTDGTTYLAVRGKLSKKRLEDVGIKLSNNIKFVDPGLLVSKMYDFGEVTKKYKIGIIPHYVDEKHIKEKYNDKYKIISMKTSDIQKVCREIKECEIILSSSLHGIIFSHSLGVPAYHIELSKLQQGDNFKFKDYYSCYDSNIVYVTFKCDNYEIPIKKITFYDKENRSRSNPSTQDILKKQNEFLSILPYKEYLNKKYVHKQNMIPNVPLVSTISNEQIIINEQSINKEQSKSKIQNLRNDIESGRVVKVPVVGGFVWKRVK